MTIGAPPSAVARTGRPAGLRGDLIWVAAAAALVAVAAVVGGLLVGAGVPVHAGAAPLFALFRPVLGWASLPAVLVGAGLVLGLPRAARTVPWPALLGLTAVAATAWTTSLALVRGPAGLLAPLSSPHEYLAVLPGLESPLAWLPRFVAGIPATAEDPWVTHVAGHPPGMTLTFQLLSGLGLPGPGPAAVLCLLAWAVAVVCVLATVRLLADEPAARAAAPFVVLLPAVVWAGVSADALLAGAGALGIHLLARARGLAGALVAGLVLGLACFLSYGAVLLALPALAVVLLRRGRTSPALLLLGAALGGTAVVLAFWGSGFAWWEGYLALRGRYYAGYGGVRPYAYWVWADVAALAVAVGPATVAGLRRGLAERQGPADRRGLAVLAGSAAAALLLAALSGMSKAEVERIWLPWAIWLPVTCALLPPRWVRPWLAVQVAVALVVEHLLATPW